MNYRVQIETERDMETLHWLAARGYDGGIWDATEELEEHEGSERVTLVIPEHAAWTVSETIEADMDAFLACCGSRTLSEALIVFWESIV